MFENASQGMFVTSFILYRYLPAVRLLASILMSFSVYRHAKSNKIDRKGLWALVAFGFPVLGRVAYCVYHRFVRKKESQYLFEQNETNNRKGALTCILSLLLSAVAGVLSVISISTMGVSVIKSIVDDEDLFEFTCYDVNGKQYSDYFDVPLYDRDGNTYSYESEWIVLGDYIGPDGKRLDGDYCYLDSDGYLVYSEKLIPCEECWCDYYYDEQGNKYYSFNGFPIYMDENGNIFEKAKYANQLFDEAEGY